MDQDLVRPSRAGDAFHYRWAARRCLKLLNPSSGVERVFIEGSEEFRLGGECSIDVAEYLEDGRIGYFQLKHTTTQMGTPFRFSDLKITLKRFLERFAADQTAPVSFHFVTNRPVSGQLKDALSKISEGRGRSSAYFKKLQKLTPMDSGGIERFCKKLDICDTEGDFRQQKSHLRKESAPYFTSAAESIEMDSLIALVAERALPVPAGKDPSAITKEEVLSQFQIGSEKVLYPADPKFDPVPNPQKRAFQDDLLERVLSDDSPLVIRASGGVGKTVVAQQLAGGLAHPHRAVVYDCFGNGSYRNPSEPRHPAKVALVQIANELARDGLCSPLIPRPHDGDPAPRSRRKWTSATSDKDWKSNVAEEEFYEILHESIGTKDWVVLHGNWTDCNNGAVETLRVKSALVHPETSDSLGRFLSCQESPYDFAFPRFSEDESTFDELPFVLQGIVQISPEDSLGLSSFDPYAGDLPYYNEEKNEHGGGLHFKIFILSSDGKFREAQCND